VRDSRRPRLGHFDAVARGGECPANLCHELPLVVYQQQVAHYSALFDQKLLWRTSWPTT
jgi:hypothetical protein